MGKGRIALKLNQDSRMALDAMREGINIIDTEGRIVFANRAYQEFLNQEAGGDIGPVEGRILRELRPGARLPEVVATGQAVLHAPRMEKKDKIYFVNMYPIRQEGQVVGGLSVVTFLKDAYDFQSELKRFEKRSKQLLRRVNKANSARYTFDSIIAVGENVQAVKALAQKAAETDATVLLASESGTGKELYAQAIHNASARKNELFVAINCANFNANTLESELFGYVEGAFTGAKKGGKMGLFEAANGGTLFLDEVSEMDYSLQAKLLRAIQEGRIRPVGGVEEIEVDVRLISASNADLQALHRGGEVPQGPLLPPVYLPDPYPAPAGAAERYPRPYPGDPSGAVPEAQAAHHYHPGGAGLPDRPRLAGQRAGAAQRAGVFRLPVGQWSDCPAVPAGAYRPSCCGAAGNLPGPAGAGV